MNNLDFHIKEADTEFGKNSTMSSKIQPNTLGRRRKSSKVPFPTATRSRKVLRIHCFLSTSAVRIGRTGGDKHLFSDGSLSARSRHLEKRSTMPGIQLNYHELEAELHRLLGRFFVGFACVELNLSLRVGGEGTFRDKLDRFIDDLGARKSRPDDEFVKISVWYMAADSFRETRNLLAHGRWGILSVQQLVVHVSGYPPGLQTERFFSIGELEDLVEDAGMLNKELKQIEW
ncbi:hypothetical protein [Massilia antarctica]|uniref:hypothetical protein n=1 Tax=Massilia antarctica TaxID=2765360 RepID=UPI0035E8F3D6